MAPADWLAMSVHHADGTVTRWGPDEHDTDRILADLTFSTVTPGGFEALSSSLLVPYQPRTDAQLGDRVVVYGPGGRIYWEGRLVALMRETGDGDRLAPNAVGYSAHLADKKSVLFLGVDRAQSRWTEPPLERRTFLAGASTGMGRFQTGPGLVWTIPNDAIADAEASELVYDAGAGVTAKKFAYDGQRQGSFTAFETPTLYSSANRDLSSPASDALTLDDTVRDVTLATAARYLMLRAYTSAATTPATGRLQRFDAAAVYGDHGLTLQAISGEPPGIFASDIIAYIVGEHAPLLNYTTGSDGTIQDTTFAVPQAAYLDFTTAADIIEDVNKYHGWDWLVYDDRTFFFQPAGSGVAWRARRSDGARLRSDGETFDVLLNQIRVEWDDGTGRIWRAGPPGSGMDVEDASLEDATLTNPVNAQGYEEKSDVLRLGDPTNEAGAVVIGALALFERNQATRRSQTTHAGSIEHPTEGQVPVARVRAGDTMTVADIPGDPPRRVIRTSYQHGSRTLTVDHDNTPPVLDAIVARLGVYTGAFVTV